MGERDADLMADWYNKPQKTYVDIKSPLLRDIIREVLQGIHGVSVREEKPSVCCTLHGVGNELTDLGREYHSLQLLTATPGTVSEIEGITGRRTE